MARTTNELKSLSQIFTDDVRFIIPDYQRGYSWGVKQLDDMWEDIENMTEGSNHYTGMFTFHTSDDKVYTIVDGQQRMTTLIILINELLSRIENGIQHGKSVEDYQKKYLYYLPFGNIPSNMEFKFQYSIDNPSDAYFKSEILGIPCIDSLCQPQNTLYTRNLRFAKDYFKEKIKDYDQQKLANLFKIITERLKFNEYIIDNLDDVYVTFETMNNRGKSLSTLELLKNRLIYLTTLYSQQGAGKPEESNINDNVKKLRNNINTTWKIIYEFLGKSNKKTLIDDAFLRDHWIMYFRYDRQTSMVFKEDLLSKHFIAKRVLNNQLLMDTVDDYVTSIGKSVVNWFNINCPEESNLSTTEQMWLSRLNRVGLGSFRPLLMAAYTHKGECSDADFESLLKACERFRFLTFNVSGRRSNTSDYYFYKLANEFFLQKPQMTIATLADNVNRVTEEWFSIDNFINASVERFNKNEGFYSWSGLRYFLYEYERNLQMGTTDQDIKTKWEIFENNQSGKISIEHIYPQSPQDDYWTSRFTTDQHKNLIHSLGNLLLLSIPKNAGEQNYSFEIKKKTVRDTHGKVSHCGYDEGSYSEIEISKENEWTPNTIINRGRKLLKFLTDHWSIPGNGFTEEQIKKLLNISPNQTINSTLNNNRSEFDNDQDEIDDSNNNEGYTQDE